MKTVDYGQKGRIDVHDLSVGHPEIKEDKDIRVFSENEIQIQASRVPVVDKMDNKYAWTVVDIPIW